MALNLASAGQRATWADGTGRMWTVVPTQRVGDNRSQRLVGVDAISKGDAWAVGDRVTGPGQSEPLIERWNGVLWRAVDSPLMGSDFSYLADVAAGSPVDVWAVGGALSGGGESTLI